MNIFHSGHMGFVTRWNVPTLVVVHVFAALLLGSFFWPVTFGGFWQVIDERIFLTLNGTLAGGDGLWTGIVAFTNIRFYDVLSALFLIALILGFVFLGKTGDIGKRFTAVLFIGLYVTIVTFARRESGLLTYGRDSPSMVMAVFHDLRTMFPGMNPKVTSGNAFPGDHGITAVLFTIMFWYFAGWRAGLISLLQIPLFVMPRLIGGAHWFTDAFVGGLAFGSMAATWALCTPFGGFCCRLLLDPVRKGQDLLARRFPALALRE